MPAGIDAAVTALVYAIRYLTKRPEKVRAA